ncbi:MAG: PEP-CTERM sorting domain-containing protein [Planctomycetaceae bacterium]|nr:PEP-CTERM sorting domain-containing protein [Planctomycetaceae bacterium]
MKREIIIGCVVSAMCLSSAEGQVRTVVDMHDENAWTVVQDPDAIAEFNFDYSIYGIPKPPNGGDDTRGIRMAANIDSGVSSAIAASPNDLVVTGQYTVAVDLWLNYYADIAKVGTTEFGGVFVGYDTNMGVFNGAGLLGDTDGDSGTDYRLFKDANLQLLESGQYDLESLDHTNPDLVDMFEGMDVPAEQLNDDVFDPPNEDGFAPDGALGYAWHTFVAEVDTDEGTANFSIDGLSIGTIDATLGDEVVLEGGVALMMTDIFSSVAPVPEFAFAIFDNLVVETEGPAGLPGDFNGDNELTALDINLLSQEIRSAVQDALFDLNNDGDVDLADHQVWVKDLKHTWFGDANLDGEFTSSDFVFAFQAGEYEDGVPMNSGWGSGDWNGDAEFDSSDFVTAFQDGGFENGPLPATAAAVPEPTTCWLFLIGITMMVFRHRKK